MPVQSGLELVRIAIGVEPHSVTCARVLETLGTLPEALRIFVRGGQLVSVRRRPSGEPYIHLISRRELATVLSCVVDFVVPVGPARPPKHIPPPAAVLDAILGAGEWPFAPLVGVSSIPVLRPDGTVRLDIGYDEGSQIFHAPPPGHHVTLSPAPDQREVRAARARLDAVFADFPFEDEASRANVLALALTPYLRPVFDGPVPLWVIRGTAPGEGKTLLAQVAGLIATSKLPSILTEGESDAEWRKRASAHLRAGGTFALIDNVGRTIDAPSLAALLTSRTWSDRVLGRTENLEVANNSLWVVTGNNLVLAGDLPRRGVLISLRGGTSRAWTRSGFSQPDLLAWVEATLPQLQAACLTLCQAWGLADMPFVKAAPFGSFQSWATTLGSVLAFAGIPGFLENRERLHLDGDTVARETEGFVREVKRCFPHTFRAGDVLAAVKAGEINLEVIPDELGNLAGQGGTKRIGKALRRWMGRRFAGDGLRVEQVEQESRSGTWTWRVVTDHVALEVLEASP